jgi:membrane protein YdbS with pleckstrin-like domain
MVFYEGLLKRTVTRVPLNRIVRFDVKRDPVDLICGTGTVSIVTEGYALKLSLKCISGYGDFREKLLRRLFPLKRFL